MLYCFEDFILDAGRRELWRTGSPIRLEPQVFDLLVFLVENRDRVVTRDDLLEAVWNGRIVSESTLGSRINAARRAISDSGEKQRLIRTIVGRGVRFTGTVRQQVEAATVHSETFGLSPARGEVSPPGPSSPLQKVTYCTTPDGVSIATASAGTGFPLVKTANWLNHIEYDWRSPIWAPLLHRLSGNFEFIRYDGRGNGLSDWDVPRISFDLFERDLETVVDHLGLHRFALFGISQGAAVAISYAARFPDRVSKLVLYGAYPLGRNRRGAPADGELAQAMLTIMTHGWGETNSAFMKAFSSLYLPDASSEQINWFVDMQRVSAPAENAVRIRVACDEIDVVDLLPKVKAPTLVLHSRYDNVAPFDQGRLAATRIPNARFVVLEGRNHVLIPSDPAWERMVIEMETFLKS